MANFTMYKTEPYNAIYKKIFSGIYNDFKENAAKEYNFELAPLAYENFIDSIEKGLLQCIILFEDEIPTGFLAYTTLISEAIELNIIHCIGNENLNQKRRLLLEKFIEINKKLMKEKIVTYPMLGKQASFADEIFNYGFRTVNTSVMSFNLSDAAAINKLKEMYIDELPNSYSLTNWNQSYFNDAAEVIHQAFKESSDSLFDSRFSTYKGCCDIVEKITSNIYGVFLPAITKVLLFKNHPVGFCFANLTNDKIANIPITAILKKHRGNGYGKIMMKQLISDIITSSITEGRALQELNVSCDTDNIAAVCLYNSSGFSEVYTYPIAYHSPLI